MKTKWREIIIVVIALLLISLVISGFAGWDNTKPSDSDAIYGWPASIRDNWDALEVVFGVNLANVFTDISNVVNVQHSTYGATGNGTTDDTVAIQAALDSGGAVIYLPTPDVAYVITTLTVPSTVKEIRGDGTARQGSLFYCTGTETNAILIEAGSGATIKLSSLRFWIQTGATYTNIINIGLHPTHSVNVGVYKNGGTCTNYWNLQYDDFFHTFIECEAWGSDDASEIGWALNGANNAVNFLGCKIHHLGVGIFIKPAAGSLGCVNFFGGSIEYNVTHGVRVGNGTSLEIGSINFFSMYFEGNPINVYLDNTIVSGVGFFGCRNYGSTSAHVFCNRAAWGIHISGGSYRSSYGGGGVLIDFNNQDSRDTVISSPYMSGFTHYSNNPTGLAIHSLSTTASGVETVQTFGHRYRADFQTDTNPRIEIYRNDASLQRITIDAATAEVGIGVDSTMRGSLILWDGAGGNTPSYIKLHSPNGTARYLFVEDDGTVKVHTAIPTANADGSAVGDQTD